MNAVRRLLRHYLLRQRHVPRHAKPETPPRIHPYAERTTR